MAVAINWALAGQQPDFAGNALKGFQEGQQMAQQQQTRSALAQYKTDPEGSINALMSVDPVAASQLRQVHTQDQADQRAQAFRNAISKGDMDEATRAAAGDPALMKGLSDFRANAVQTSQLIAGKIGALKAVPQEQRAAYVQSNLAPDLKAMGLPVEKLAGLDLSDAGIDAAMRQQMSVADQLKQDNSNRDFGLKVDTLKETARHDTATEGQQAATLKETSRHNSASEATAGISAGAAASNASTNAKKLGFMMQGGGLTPEDMETYAQRYAVDGSLPQLMGPMGTAAKTQIMHRGAEILRGNGGTGADFAATVAGAKANSAALTDQTKKSAAISAAEATANKTGDLALQLAKQGGSGPSAAIFNRPIQQIRGQFSDPQAAAFNNALGTFRDEYAKVIGGGGAPTDALRHDVDSRINRAMSVPELERVISTMKQEMEFRTQSQSAGQSTLKGNIRTGGGIPTPAAQAGAARPSLDQILPRTK